MKLLLLTALFLLMLSAAAQKVVHKSVFLPADHLLQIDARQCFLVELDTNPGNTLEVEAMAEGEYNSEVLLLLGTEGSTTKVTADLTPLFVVPDDKLGAHKVISIALKVSLPEYRRVEVYGNLATITAHGLYETLRIFLEEGTCSLTQVGQSVDVETRTADIYVESAAASILAESLFGEVSPNQIPQGANRFRLRTILGNIHLKRRE